METHVTDAFRDVKSILPFTNCSLFLAQSIITSLDLPDQNRTLFPPVQNPTLSSDGRNNSVFFILSRLLQFCVCFPPSLSAPDDNLPALPLSRCTHPAPSRASPLAAHSQPAALSLAPPLYLTHAPPSPRTAARDAIEWAVLEVKSIQGGRDSPRNPAPRSLPPVASLSLGCKDLFLRCIKRTCWPGSQALSRAHSDRFLTKY